MNNNFFETESAHSNIMYWWHGVIVDDKFWAGCTDEDVSNENSKLHYAKQLEERPRKGWGKRYKVAIVGRHYAIKEPCSQEADVLEMAEVVYPVTAGTGLGATHQTAALRQGAHVVGFYADGKEGRNPVILGAFGVNEQNEPIIYPGDAPQFFQLRSGNKGCCGEKLKPVGEKDINLEADKKPIEAIESPLQAAIAHRTKAEDGNLVDEVKPTYSCETPTGIISQIKSLLNKLSYITNLVKRGISDLTINASSIISSITRQITGLTSALMDRMRGFIVNKINDGVKDVMNLIPPFWRPDFNQVTQDELTGLSCAFNNIKNNLFEIVKDLAKQFVDNYVNAPICAATTFLGGMLGNVIGQINGAVSNAVNGINEALNIGLGYEKQALNVIDIALDLLKLFECDRDRPECPGTVKWSFWRGPNEIAVSVADGASRLVKDIINEVETDLPGSASGASSNPCNSRQVPCGPPKVQITGGGGSGASANAVVSVTGKILGLDFSSFGSGYTSSPQINVVDSCGTGGGAVVQPIMQPTGTFNEFQEEIFNLVGAVVEDAGTQFLPAPNGTTGGNGLIFSQPSDTIQFETGSTQIINGKEVKGTGYNVIECGTTFSVKAGDEVYMPSGTVANVFNNVGEVVQVLNGLGPTTKIDITATGTLTAPCNPDNVPTVPLTEYPLSTADTFLPPITRPTETGGIVSTPTSPTRPVVSLPLTPVGESLPQPTTPIGESLPTSSTTTPSTSLTDGGTTITTQPEISPELLKISYPIVAEIESVFIKNPGFNYTEEDKITIQGNKGAELDFKVNDVGEITEVVVVNGGLGFTDVPFIAISSPTGYNFEAVAVFKFTPLANINLNNITPPPGAKLINVVDCVGKVNE